MRHLLNQIDTKRCDGQVYGQCQTNRRTIEKRSICTSLFKYVAPGEFLLGVPIHHEFEQSVV